MNSTCAILVEDIISWYDHQTHKIEIGSLYLSHAETLPFSLLFFSYSIPWYPLPFQAYAFCLCYLFMFWVLPSPCQKVAISFGHCVPEGSQAPDLGHDCGTNNPCAHVFPLVLLTVLAEEPLPTTSTGSHRSYVIFETWHPLSEATGSLSQERDPLLMFLFEKAGITSSPSASKNQTPE